MQEGLEELLLAVPVVVPKQHTAAGTVARQHTGSSTGYTGCNNLHHSSPLPEVCVQNSHHHHTLHHLVEYADCCLLG